MFVKAVQFLKQQYLVFLHVLFLLFLFFIYKFSGLQQFNVNTHGFINFDASWYYNLKENGYIYTEGAQSNSGFYPTFSFIWKLTGFSTLGISIFNALIFLSSLVLLKYEFKLSKKESLLLLSLPSCMFFFVPYTEALFFLSSTILLVGIKKEKNVLILIGIFFSCLIRPVWVIFVPILIFFYLIPKKKYLIGSLNIFILLLACFVPFFIVTLIQWLETGIWFAHSTAQIKYWDHCFHIPHFPLTTWGGPRILWLDGVAFWIGILSSVICLLIFFGKNTLTRISTPLLFSFCYLSCTTFVVLFLNGYNEEGKTTVLSLNRYFFATPFFFLAFLQFLRLPPVSKKRTALLILSLIGVWILFGAYTSIDWYNRTKTIIYFSILTLSVLGYFLILNNKWMLEKRIWILLYIANCMLQAYLFFRFLSGNWVG